MRMTMPFIIAVVLGFTSVGAAAATDTLDRIRQSGEITLAYSPDSLPVSYTDANGSPTGYSVEICRRIVAHLKEVLGLEELKASWITGNTPERLQAVAAGKADLECGTTTVTLDRQEEVDFSNFVFVESGGILVRADAGIERLTHLEGKKIAVTPGTTTEKRLRRELDKNAISSEFVSIMDAGEGMVLLEKGDVDAVAGDRLVLVGRASGSDLRDKLALMKDQFSFDPYAFALPRGDAAFRLEINRALAALYRSDEIAKIFRQSFGTSVQPGELVVAIYLLYGFAD